MPYSIESIWFVLTACTCFYLLVWWTCTTPLVSGWSSVELWWEIYKTLCTNKTDTDERELLIHLPLVLADQVDPKKKDKSMLKENINYCVKQSDSLTLLIAVNSPGVLAVRGLKVLGNPSHPEERGHLTHSGLAWFEVSSKCFYPQRVHFMRIIQIWQKSKLSEKNNDQM